MHTLCGERCAGRAVAHRLASSHADLAASYMDTMYNPSRVQRRVIDNIPCTAKDILMLYCRWKPLDYSEPTQKTLPMLHLLLVHL